MLWKLLIGKKNQHSLTRKVGKFAQLAFQFYYVFSSQYIPLISKEMLSKHVHVCL